VTGRVDKIDQKFVTVVVVLEELHIAFVKLVKERNGGRFDGNGSLLLIFSSISESGLACSRTGDDTGFGYERIGKGGLAVVDVSDDGHVSDVLLPVHDLTDLIYGKIDHGRRRAGFLGSLEKYFFLSLFLL